MWFPFPHFHAFQPSQDMFCSFGFNSVPVKYLSAKTIPVWAKKGAVMQELTGLYGHICSGRSSSQRLFWVPRPNDLAQLVSMQLNEFISPKQDDLIQTYF